MNISRYIIIFIIVQVYIYIYIIIYYYNYINFILLLPVQPIQGLTQYTPLFSAPRYAYIYLQKIKYNV